MSKRFSKFDLLRLYALPQTVCYEDDSQGTGDSGSTSDSGDDGSDGSEGARSHDGSGRTFTQEELNKYLAEDRRKHAQKMKALEDQLTSTLKNAQLTEQEREQLEASLSDVQKQLMTKEQVAAQEKKKLASQYEQQIKELQERAQQYENRYTDSTIKRALTDAAVANEAFNAEQIVTLLRPHTKLVDDKPVVDFTDRHVETGEEIVTQLSPQDAVKRMRELSEVHGNLFKANVVTGMGSNSGQHSGGKIDRKSLTPEQYRKLRKENPEALYG